MIDLQQAATADRIADLAREGAALRAERARNDAHEDAATQVVMRRLPVQASSRRVRLGRWLVALGEAITGPNRSPIAEPGRASEPCDDEPAGLERAA